MHDGCFSRWLFQPGLFQPAPINLAAWGGRWWTGMRLFQPVAVSAGCYFNRLFQPVDGNDSDDDDSGGGRGCFRSHRSSAGRPLQTALAYNNYIKVRRKSGMSGSG